MKPFDACPSADGLWTGLRLPARRRRRRHRGGARAWSAGSARAPRCPPSSHAPARARRRRRARHAGPGRLPHAPGLRRPARQRVRDAAGRRQLRRSGEGRRRHRLQRARHARGERRRTVRQRRRRASQSLLAEGVCAIEIKSGYGLALEHERKQLRVARRLGEAHGVTVRTTFLGAHALPPEYAGRSSDYIDLVCRRDAARARGRRAGRRGRRVLRAHRVLARRNRARLPGRAGARPAGQAACRAAVGHGRRRAGGALRRAVVRPHRAPVAGRHRRDARRRHRRRAAAGRLLHAARHAAAADRRAARGRRADGRVDRPQPRHLAGAEPAADGEHGLHAVPPDRARGDRRRDRACGARAGPAGHARRASRPACRPTSCCGTCGEAAELAYWFGQRPVRTVVRQGRIAEGVGA